MIVFPKPVYDVLKWIALVVLPALATFYFVMAGVWGWPYAGQVVASITAVNTLLGAVLGISSSVYNNSDARFDGTLNVTESDTSQIHQLEITTPPEKVAAQKEMILKVHNVPPVVGPPLS